MSLKLGETLIAGALPAPAGAMTYKGSCLQSALPTTGQVTGDYWKLTDTTAPYSGQCAIWNGTTWDYSSGSIEVDSSLSSTSTNPVENKVITNALTNLDYIAKTNTIKSVWSGTLAEYNAIASKEATKLYNITDDNVIIDGCLPLSGGTMTGSITALSNTDFGIHASDSSTYLGLSGSDGTSAYDGCVLFLTGKDQADWHGGFGIRTGNGNAAESISFTGHPNGELKWRNRRIDAMTISTTGLSVSGVGGFTATMNAQRCIDHELYYEYYIVMTISGTFDTANQSLVANITGLLGTQLYTHQPCSVWCEGGGGTEQGLFYGNQVYIGMCPTSADKDRRVFIHTMRMK